MSIEPGHDAIMVEHMFTGQSVQGVFAAELLHANLAISGLLQVFPRYLLQFA